MFDNQLDNYQKHVQEIMNLKSPSKKIPKLKKFLEFIEKEQKILKEKYPNGYPDSDNEIKTQTVKQEEKKQH